MASRALSKEIRGLVSAGKSQVRKKLKEDNATEKLVVSGSTMLGTTAVALSDAYTDDGEARKLGPVPVGAIGGALSAGIGLAIGKGAIGAMFLGPGIGAINASMYRAIYDSARKRIEEEG